MEFGRAFSRRVGHPTDHKLLHKREALLPTDVGADIAAGGEAHFVAIDVVALALSPLELSLLKLQTDVLHHQPHRRLGVSGNVFVADHQVLMVAEVFEGPSHREAVVTGVILPVPTSLQVGPDHTEGITGQVDDADVEAREFQKRLEPIQILRRVDDDVAPRHLGDCFVEHAIVVGENLRILSADVKGLQLGIAGGLESLIHVYPERAGRQVVRPTSAWVVEMPGEHLQLADADHLRVGAD